MNKSRAGDIVREWDSDSLPLRPADYVICNDEL
jgi:hypothetical protein